MMKDRDQEYRKKQSLYTIKLWREGVYDPIKKPLETRSCINSVCINKFQIKPSSPKKYCSRNCAATVNNKIFIKRPVHKLCKNCIQKLNRSAKVYCSFYCQNNYQYERYINKWRAGIVSGNKGITTKVISSHIKRYLKEKYGEKCSLCGWDQKHPMTKRVPIEIDHIDGNADNNKEENLRLICPNCHSLTPNFRNLNKGKGRAWRLTYIAQHKTTPRPG